jgi:hypothetical protein
MDLSTAIDGEAGAQWQHHHHQQANDQQGFQTVRHVLVSIECVS